jgi:hypothetical protein
MSCYKSTNSSTSTVITEHRFTDLFSALPRIRRRVGARSNFFWGTFRCKRPNATLGANSGFDEPSMIALASSRIPELDARLWKGSRRLGNSVASINTSQSEAICYSEQVQRVFNRAWLSCRRLSKSARWRLWCSNSVSSPAHRTVCRSAQDSRSFSCGDGTLRRRIACSMR